jgi:predicted ribosome quality control (RQC) complex YloA/Tae2 family protein
MTLSRAEIELILEEIKPLAGRCVIQRVLEADRRTRVLQLRQPGQTHHLLLSTQPEATRIHFVDARPEQPDKPSAFTMQLRKWLGGALLEQVEQLGRDRIVRLGLAAVDPSWEPAEDHHERAPRVDISLVVELTGRHPNWFLLDDDDTIIGQLDAEVIGERELTMGAPYEPPAPPPDPSVGSRVRWGLERLDAAERQRSRRLDRHYGRELDARQLEQAYDDLAQRLKRRTERLERRIEHVEGDLARAENAQEYKRRGELLQSAWGKVERGASSVRVPDFYDEDMPEVEIPLDPALALQENIEQNFHEYHRLEQARDKIERRLLESIEQRDAARSALDTLADHREDLEELEAFAERLESEGILPAAKDKRPSRRGDTKRLPYREFESKHGSTILVGRGASDNDTLSTSVARGRDMWFHARDWAGAHVVLRMRKDDDSPKSDDLLDAATLAAWFSRGKEDTVVDVTYTRAKYVRKPKGFPPGRVTIADASTIGVAIEDERVERLLDSEQR